MYESLKAIHCVGTITRKNYLFSKFKRGLCFEQYTPSKHEVCEGTSEFLNTNPIKSRDT